MKMKTAKKGLIAFCALACVASAGVGVAQLSGEIAQASAEFTVAMKEGASLRIGEEDGQNGLTYTVTMPKGEYETLMNNVGDGKKYKEVEFGVLIAPYAYHQYKALDEANVFGTSAFYDWAEWTEGADGKYSWTYEDVGKVRIMNFTADTMYLENATDTYYSYAGSIVNILDGTNTDETNPDLLNNLTNEFYGVGYVKTTLNSDGTVAYSFAADNANNVSPAYIAQRAYAEDTKLTGDEKTWLKTNYIDKAVADTNNSYTVEEYFANEDGEYVLDDTKTQTVAVTNFKYGSTITAAKKIYSGYQFNAKKTGSLTREVYFNGKLCVKQYYDKVALVDKNAATTYDLTSVMSESVKTAIAEADNVTYTLTATNNASNVKTFTDSTVTLSELANGAYSLEAVSGEDTLFTGTLLDICDSTVFELVDETDFAGSFERNTGAQYTTFTQATDDELNDIGMTGPAMKGAYTRGVGMARLDIVAMHSDAYYTTYFGDKTLKYDFYMTADAGAPDTTEFTVHYDVYGNRTAMPIETVNTISITVSNLITERSWMLCRVYINNTENNTHTGSVYWGNFRLAKAVELYEEADIAMFDKNGKTVTAVAWSDLMSAEGAAHVAGYEDLTYTLTYQNTSTKIADYTTETVDLTNLSGLYVLTVATGEDTIYSGVVDIFNSTVFEWVDTTILAESFEANSTSTLSITEATGDEATYGALKVTGATISTQEQYIKVRVKYLMHSEAYYTTYFNDGYLTYTMYVYTGETQYTVAINVGGSKGYIGSSATNDSGYKGSCSSNVSYTIKIKIANLFARTDGYLPLANLTGQIQNNDAFAIYYGEFSYTE